MEKDKHSKKINLKDMEKKNIHSVPDGYFDKLPYSIQEKIKAKQKPWFEKLKLSPIRYALSGLAVIILAIFIYLIIPKSQRQVAQNKTTVTKKNTTIYSPEKTNQDNNTETTPVPLNNNSVIGQEKIKPDSIDKNKNIPVIDEKLLNPESYLADISKDDIQEYLDLNELDQLQPDGAITD
ncbi:MAG TPA: hypothetical protein VNW99_09320 [Cytophagaceae bacterium]|jgi:hypothetical protein|nr:hypothetical protein [Cytophagaceae bacterium]